MTPEIITRDRLVAMSHLSRWRGWTVRPYSVGEHVAVGAWTMAWFKRPADEIRAWWLHDLHETEIIGDVPTPDKELYVNDKYHHHVRNFDFLAGVYDVPVKDSARVKRTVKRVDDLMRDVEHDMIVTRRCGLRRPNYDHDPFAKMIRDTIMDQRFCNSDTVVRLWNSHAAKCGLPEVV